jgi:toxin ParE1/3/4
MKRLPIERTSRAEDDLIEIWLYVAHDNPAAADRLLDRIEARCQQLSALPFSGMARDDLQPEARHLVIGNHLIFYRVAKEEIVVLRVLDGRRNIAAKDLEID